MDRTDAALSAKCLLAIFTSVVMVAGSAFAGSMYSVVYPFPNASHGYRPYELIADSAGNLYGATQYGATRAAA